VNNIIFLIGRDGSGLPASAAVTILGFMCGRFTRRSKPEASAAEFGLPSVPLLGLGYDFAPTQPVVVVQLDPATHRRGSGSNGPMLAAETRIPPAVPARYDAAGGVLCLVRSRGMPGC
jgi:hypothetical protein